MRLSPSALDMQPPAATDPLTALRLRLLANGYTPLPNRDKICLQWDWPRLRVTEVVIIS